MCMGLSVNDSVSDYANSINHWYQKHGPRQSSHTGCLMHYPILTFWHDNSRDSSGSNSRADGISLLVDIDLSVPASPCSGGGEHPTTSTHVSESSLAWPVGTTSPYTGDTGHSSSCTPGLSWSLVTLNRDQYIWSNRIFCNFQMTKTFLFTGQICSHTCFLADSIWLSGVLPHLRMDKHNYVWPDGRPKHCRQCNIAFGCLPLVPIHTYKWPGCL